MLPSSCLWTTIHCSSIPTLECLQLIMVVSPAAEYAFVHAGLDWEELCKRARILLHRYNLSPTMSWVKTSPDAAVAPLTTQILHLKLTMLSRHPTNQILHVMAFPPLQAASSLTHCHPKASTLKRTNLMSRTADESISGFNSFLQYLGLSVSSGLVDLEQTFINTKPKGGVAMHRLCNCCSINFFHEHDQGSIVYTLLQHYLTIANEDPE